MCSPARQRRYTPPPGPTILPCTSVCLNSRRSSRVTSCRTLIFTCDLATSRSYLAVPPIMQTSCWHPSHSSTVQQRVYVKWLNIPFKDLNESQLRRSIPHCLLLLRSQTIMNSEIMHHVLYTTDLQKTPYFLTGVRTNKIVFVLRHGCLLHLTFEDNFTAQKWRVQSVKSARMPLKSLIRSAIRLDVDSPMMTMSYTIRKSE